MGSRGIFATCTSRAPRAILTKHLPRLFRTRDLLLPPNTLPPTRGETEPDAHGPGTQRTQPPTLAARKTRRLTSISTDGQQTDERAKRPAIENLATSLVSTRLQVRRRESRPPRMRQFRVGRGRGDALHQGGRQLVRETPSTQCTTRTHTRGAKE